METRLWQSTLQVSALEDYIFDRLHEHDSLHLSRFCAELLGKLDDDA